MKNLTEKDIFLQELSSLMVLLDNIHTVTKEDRSSWAVGKGRRQLSALKLAEQKVKGLIKIIETVQK